MSNDLPMIVGLRGEMGSGKDCFALFLNQFHKDFEICRFSKGLREAACILTGMKLENTWSDKAKATELDIIFTKDQFVTIVRQMVLFVMAKDDYIWEVMASKCCLALHQKENDIHIKMTFGTLLQKLGTDFFRNLDENCFVDYLYRVWNKKTPLIITDVRFPNEMKFVHERGGIIVLITRPLVEKRKDGRDKNHLSEIALKDIKSDYIVENNETLFELEKKAHDFFSHLL